MGMKVDTPAILMRKSVMSSIPNKVDYDQKFDVLYYNMSNTGNSYGDEIDDNIVLLRDIDTDKITGVTIIGYNKFFVVNSQKINLLSKYIDVKGVL